MAAVERYRVTRLLARAGDLQRVLHTRERSRYDLSSLRQLIIGGAPASPDLVRPSSGARAPAMVGYGLTETSPILTLAEPGRPDRQRAARAAAGAPVDDRLGDPRRPDPGRRRGRRATSGPTASRSARSSSAATP